MRGQGDIVERDDEGTQHGDRESEQVLMHAPSTGDSEDLIFANRVL